MQSLGNTGPAVRPVGRKKEKDEGIRRSERLLLTWLIEEPSLYARIKDIIGPEDFVKPLYKEAKAVFEGLEAEMSTGGDFESLYRRRGQL